MTPTKTGERSEARIGSLTRSSDSPRKHLHKRCPLDRWFRFDATTRRENAGFVARKSGGNPLHQIDAELSRGVAAQHSGHGGLRDIRFVQLLNRVPCAGRIL